MGKIFRRGIDFSGGGGSISNPTAASVTFDNTDTGLEATNVQDAVTEVNGKLGSISNPTASSVTFDNTDTGLNATNVQDAVTEVNGKLGSISNPTAASVTFNNTDTGLNSTNVQDAVTEVNSKLVNYGNDIIMGKLLSYADKYVLDLFKNAPINYSPTFGELNIGGPVVTYIMQKHSDYYGGAVIVFGYNNLRPIYYHIAHNTIDAEYYL